MLDTISISVIISYIRIQDFLEVQPIHLTARFKWDKFKAWNWDNDNYRNNCTVPNQNTINLKNGDGWWFSSCSLMYPNVDYAVYQHMQSIWFNNVWYCLPYIEMIIKPKVCSSWFFASSKLPNFVVLVYKYLSVYLINVWWIVLLFVIVAVLANTMSINCFGRFITSVHDSY